jgi:hypothetical protein
MGITGLDLDLEENIRRGYRIQLEGRRLAYKKKAYPDNKKHIFVYLPITG